MPPQQKASSKRERIENKRFGLLNAPRPRIGPKSCCHRSAQEEGKSLLLSGHELLELIEVIRGQVLPRKSTIYTDGWRAYDGLVLEGYKHHRIHHHDNEFAREHRHINGIESFWSYAKLRLAKLRGVRWEYFYDHLKETEWRFNHRRENLFNFLIIDLGSTPLI